MLVLIDLLNGETVMKKVVRTVCQDSHFECGVLVHVEDGKVTKIEGDPKHPQSRGFICVKGRAQPQILYHPERLKYPLKRVGERGEGKWQRVSWDQALDGIAEKFTEVRKKYGPEANGTYVGTGPRGSSITQRLLATALGTPTIVATDLHICFAPSLVAENWLRLLKKDGFSVDRRGYKSVSCKTPRTLTH